MEWIDVLWRHDFPDEPVRLVSELDEGRDEIRKLEFFRDGRVGVASAAMSCLDTRLGEAPLPSLQEINADPEFVAVSISRDAFEALWERHVAPR